MSVKVVTFVIGRGILGENKKFCIIIIGDELKQDVYVRMNSDDDGITISIKC